MNANNNSGALRTHRCGEISESMVGQEVKVAGWASRIRDLGGVVFVGLRDRYGLVQVVCEDGEPLEMAKGFKLESVLGISGTVRRRPDDMVNPDMATGSIEIGRACVGKECRSRWSPYH